MFNLKQEVCVHIHRHRHRHCSTESALIDLFLLSKTKKVIGCRSSSFGRFGAWYGGKRFIIQDK